MELYAFLTFRVFIWNCFFFWPLLFSEILGIWKNWIWGVIYMAKWATGTMMKGNEEVTRCKENSFKGGSAVVIIILGEMMIL